MKRVFGQRLNRTAGFSLIEIFVILMILTIAAAAAIPSYKNIFQSMRLKQTAQDLVHYLHYGRTRALMRQRPLRLSVDVSQGRFWLEEQRRREDGKDQFAVLEDRLGAVYRIPADFELRTDAVSVDLFRGGRMSRSELCLCSKKECVSVRTGIILGEALVEQECTLER